MLKLQSGGSRTWIVTSLLAAGAVLYVYFVFLPGQQAIRSLQTELDQKQQVIVQAGQLTLAIQQVNNERDATQRFVDQWRQSAPDESKLSAVFGAISDEASRAGVSLEHVEPQTRVRFDTVWRVPVAIRCQGGFEQIARFLEAVENLPQTLWVTNLTLTATGKAGDAPRIATIDQPIGGGLPVGEGGDSVRCELTLAIFADNDAFSE